ncbi:MAG: matrixin family metalloprotease [Proteobacteria bacterium]|nr:matrixin family metalloprotease [Pseudomonadota bacterium]
MTNLILILICCINSLYGFNLSSARWTDGKAEVIFSSTMAPQNAQLLKSGAWINETKTAFSRWTMANGVTFNLTYSTEDCANNCTINNDKNEVYWMAPGVEPINMPAGALAVTLRRQFDDNMVEVDLVVNNTFDQILLDGRQPTPSRLCVLGGGPAPGYSNCFDFPSIVTHEIGHFFGLDHSSEDSTLSPSDPRRKATMYYSLAPDGSLIPLTTDDVAGMTCLYPTDGAPYKVEACCESYNPFYRAPGCSHAFSDKSIQSLDVGGGTAGCGYIKDLNSKGGNDNGNKNLFLIFFVVLIPLLILYLNKIILGTRKV